MRFALAVAAALAFAAVRADELEVARSALRDGLWDIAVAHAERVDGSDPARQDLARAVILEALAGSGRRQEIPIRVNTWGADGSDCCRYWKAWASEGAGDHAAAAKALAADFTDPRYAALARRLRARVAAAAGDRAAADAAFREVSAAATTSAERTANALEWARALANGGDAGAALAVLAAEVPASAEGEGADEARLFAAELRRGSGDAAGADEILQRLVAAGSNTCEHAYVRAAVALSRSRSAAGEAGNARNFARLALARAADPQERRVAGFHLAFTEMFDPDLRSNAVARVRALVREAPGAQDSKEAQLELADRLLELRDDAAAAEYQAFLEAYPDSALAFRALAGSGWALLNLGRDTEALGMFARAAKAATNAADRARLEFKQADVLAGAGRFEEAASIYASIPDRYPELPLAESARFNRARALKAGGDEAGAAAEFAKVAADGGPLAGSARLELAAFDSDRGRVEEALAAYTKVVEDFPDDAKLVAEARVGRGRAYYRAWRFNEAAADFAYVAEREPARRAAMRFLGALCRYGAGDDADAEKEARAVLAEFPASPLVPEITLWLAKLDFNRGDYSAAAKAMAAYASKWPRAPHAAEALVWAARAAFAADAFARAVELVTTAAKLYPDSPALADGLLLQGEALMELGRFDEAVVVLEQVASAEQRSDRSVRAAIMRADCHFALGADNEARYTEALREYREILADEALSPEQRLQVAFKTGLALEKLGRAGEAEDQLYVNVVLHYLKERESGVWFDDRGCAVFANAAFRLAERHEQAGEYAQAEKVLQLVVNANVPASDEAKARIADIGEKRSLQ